jgi:hypothetical protein
MGRRIETTVRFLRFPAFDQFKHFLVVRIFEFPDTLFTPVSFFAGFKYTEAFQINRMALVRNEHCGESVEDDFCVRTAARGFRRKISAYNFSAPISVPFRDAN